MAKVNIKSSTATVTKILIFIGKKEQDVIAYF